MRELPSKAQGTQGPHTVATWPKHPTWGTVMECSGVGATRAIHNSASILHQECDN